MSPLERRCRWLLRAYPAWYRPSQNKVFGVNARAGSGAAPAPLGRLEIGDEGIAVRSWLSAAIAPRFAPKETIGEVICYGWPAIFIKFVDQQGVLADLTLMNPTRLRRILRELRTRGYPVTDRHGPRLLPPDDTGPRSTSSPTST